MMIGFIDDTEIRVNPDGRLPNVYVLGGYFVEQARLQHLQKRIAEVKLAYGFEIQHPVKWNLRDSKLNNFYTKRGETDAYERLRSVSDEIRKSLLALIPELQWPRVQH